MQDLGILLPTLPARELSPAVADIHFYVSDKKFVPELIAINCSLCDIHKNRYLCSNEWLLEYRAYGSARQSLNFQISSVKTFHSKEKNYAT